MALFKLREYTVADEHFAERALQLAVPKQWVVDHLKVGDTLGIYADPNNERLIIQVVKNGDASKQD